MIKAISLFRKKPGMSREDFIRYYEEKHVPLVRSFNFPMLEYRRNYVVSPAVVGATGLSPSGEVSLGFDVVTEGWFKDRAAREEMRRIMSDPDILARIVEDEENFFDRTHMIRFEVEEYGAE